MKKTQSSNQFDPEKFFEVDPKPHRKQRTFHGHRIAVWEGRVNISKISGWVDNPRIQLAAKAYKAKYGDRELDQDEVFEIMKMDSDVQLKSLRDDILANGLREPLILSREGKLLDGNRRFFALKFALENISRAELRRKDLEFVECHVLESGDPEEERLVLVEENFHASLKIEWPDYVKANFIRDSRKEGMDDKAIAQKYGWTARKVAETIKILELIDDFLEFATRAIDREDEYGGGLGLAETEAEDIAARSYQFFNEAQKSFFKELRSDLEFQTNFFRWIANQKFKSFSEVRAAHAVWRDPQARAVLVRDDPNAAKEAKTIVDYKNRVLSGQSEAKIRIDDFAKFLDGLTSAVMSELPGPSLELLYQSMQRVYDMARAAKKRA